MKKNKKKIRTVGKQTTVVPIVANGKYSLEEYRKHFMGDYRIIDRKPIFISRELRDKLDWVARQISEDRMSLSGFMENIARHHLETYKDDIEEWRKL